MKFFASKRTQRLTNFALAALLVVSTLTASVPFLFSQKADAAGPGTVLTATPTSTNGWATEDGAPAYVAGPTGATGNGSLKFQAVGNSDKNNYFHATTNTPLSAANNLGYSVYDTAGVPASYQLKVLGVNRLDGNTNGYTTLIWEPVYNGQSNGPTAGFKDDNNLETGIWWSSNPIPGAPNRDTFVSLQSIAAANPGAYIVGYGANVGSGTPGAVSYVDNVRFGNTSTNFEITPPAAPAGLRFAEFACGGATNINSITPTWDAASGAVSYNYRATLPDGSVYGPVSVGSVTSLNGPFGAEGISSFAVQSVDANGITSDWSNSCAANYDATAPTAPVAQNPNGWTNGANAFSWSVPVDSGSALHYELQYSRTHPNNVADNDVIVNNAHTFATTLSDGPLFWRVRAIDAAGNISPWSNLQSATIDATAPVLTPSLVGGVVRGTQQISLNISEPYLKASAIRILNPDYSSVSATPGVSNQLGTGNPLNYTWNTKLINDGTYKVQYSARDILDHSTSVFYDVVVDNAAPTISGVTYGTKALTANTVINGSQTFTALLTEANPYRTYVEVDVKAGNTWQKIAGQYSTGASANAATLNFNTVGLSETATYQLKISTDDAAGNHSGQAIPFTIDNTPPDFTIKSGAQYTQGSNGVYNKVSFALHDAHQIDKVTINGVVKDLSNNNYSDVNGVTKGIFGAVEGSNTLIIYDVAGNKTTYNFTIDTQNPNVTITSPLNEATFGNNAVVPITGSTDDAVSYVLSISNTNVAVSGTSFTSYDWDTTGVASGAYTATLTGTDAAGNSSSDEVVINIDNDGPATTVTAGTYTTLTPTLTGTVDTDATSVNVFVIDSANNTIDSGLATHIAGSASWSYTVQNTLTNGATYTILAIAKDVFGNASSTANTGSAQATVAVPAANSNTNNNPLVAVTPIITSPAAAVLGATTDNSADANKDAAVKGTSDDKTADAVNSDANKGTIFGLAWYWWILILAALAAIAWFIIAAIRRRNADEA